MMPDYGNVPPEDVQAMQNAALVTARVVDHLPGEAPSAWRLKAYDLILGGILNDWVTNGTNELDDEDADDLANLMEIAYDIASGQEHSVRDIAFEVILKHAMADWVENWNLDE